MSSDLGSAPVPPLRADDHVRGAAGDPLVIVYGDFTCPHCAVAQERLRDAPLRVVFRHFALRAKHPRAVALAYAAEAAARQGAFWPFHDSLYADQGRIDDPHLWERCARLGLDLDRFEADRRGDPAVATACAATCARPARRRRRDADAVRRATPGVPGARRGFPGSAASDGAGVIAAAVEWSPSDTKSQNKRCAGESDDRGQKGSHHMSSAT